MSRLSNTSRIAQAPPGTVSAPYSTTVLRLAESQFPAILAVNAPRIPYLRSNTAHRHAGTNTDSIRRTDPDQRPVRSRTTAALAPSNSQNSAIPSCAIAFARTNGALRWRA